MNDRNSLRPFALGTPPWRTIDPFLFCVHHRDDYPAGNDKMGPKDSLAGRHIGSDFAGKDGWSMYHGDVIPGFPRHPHRGFETVTLARAGYIDHSDSLGATARFGKGDCQWMTAGAGVVHSEMFPLVEKDKGNPTELFQIWLNLPASDKLVPPHFRMLWGDEIPRHRFEDDKGGLVEVVTVAGELNGTPVPAPTPHSWAAREQAEVAIWTLKLSPGTSFTLPACRPDTQRALYYFIGEGVEVGGKRFDQHTGLLLPEEVEVLIVAGASEVEILLLQGRPIGEPVAQHGPFVMNSQAEVQKAFGDYQRTGFGGWPFAKDDPVHPREEGRFARHADGKEERPASRNST